jgi:hypothetical protein
MSDTRTAIFAMLASRHHAEVAVDALVQSGFSAGDISVLLPVTMPREAAREKSLTPEGDSSGGPLGWLVGMGALSIPGLGPFLVAGPFMTSLDSAGARGLAGALVHDGMSEYEARRYQNRVRAGGVLLSLLSDTAEEARAARDVLEQTGAEDVAAVGEAGHLERIR